MKTIELDKQEALDLLTLHLAVRQAEEDRNRLMSELLQKHGLKTGKFDFARGRIIENGQKPMEDASK